MAFDIVGVALDFIAQYGLIAIFILLVLDGALLLPVFPGELVLIMAVATYATGPDGLIMLIVLSTVAGLVGSLILYGITRGGGRRLVEKYPRFFMMPKKRRERLEKSFRKPLGQSAVLFLRLFPLTRVLVSIPAGLAKMPMLRFVVMSTIGLTLYHAGFLWFTYEVRQPDSTIAAQTDQLQQAYASPAWNFIEANTIIAGAALLLLGAILSVRSTRAMLKDPEEAGGSLIGNLATLALFWGGIGLAVATYLDPETVYTLIEVGGVDIARVSAQVGYSPLQVLWGTATLAVLLGYSISRYRRAAQEKRKRDAAVLKALEAEKAKVKDLERRLAIAEAKARKAGMPVFQPVDEPAASASTPRPASEPAPESKPEPNPEPTFESTPGPDGWDVDHAPRNQRGPVEE